MEGTVTWPQATFIIGLLCAATVASFIAAWRMQALRLKDRSEARAHFDLRLNIIQTAFMESIEALKARISTIEQSNAGTIVVLKHLEDFRVEVKQQYEKLVTQREEDMRGLNVRLNAIGNVARMERINNEDAMQGKDKK